jgi:hypothetical protein
VPQETEANQSATQTEIEANIAAAEGMPTAPPAPEELPPPVEADAQISSFVLKRQNEDVASRLVKQGIFPNKHAVYRAGLVCLFERLALNATNRPPQK